MLTINQATILGRLGKDPEVRSTKSGMTVATLSVATDYTSGKGDSRETVTEWHNVVCFDKTAEYIGEALHKGDPVFVQGRIQTRKWQDKNGNDRYTTEIVANDMQMLGGGAGRGMGGEGRGQAARAAGGDSGPAEPVRSSTERDEFDDDIPF